MLEQPTSLSLRVLLSPFPFAELTHTCLAALVCFAVPRCCCCAGEPDTKDARATLVMHDARQRLPHDADDSVHPVGIIDYTPAEESEGYKHRVEEGRTRLP